MRSIPILPEFTTARIHNGLAGALFYVIMGVINEATSRPKQAMTALSEYDRLECSGLWRPTPDDKRREVIVALGNATLVLSDTSGRALAHWSLPAVHRLSDIGDAAIYAPAETQDDATETIELTDETMINAIDKVQATIDKTRPHPGRLRYVIFAGFISAIAALSVFWLPDALVSHTLSVVPAVKRHEIGTRLLTSIRRVTGTACTTPTGSRALTQLGKSLGNGGPATTFSIMPSGTLMSTHLPGGHILLNHELVEDFEEPDVIAGYIVAEQIRIENQDPLEGVLRFAGLRQTFTLLTTGDIADETLDKYAERLLVLPIKEVEPQTLLARFKTTQLRMAPYAYALDPTGETTLHLIEADPFPVASPKQLLADADWISLQAICGE